MCQAYESEARFFMAMSSSVAQTGFEDKLNGKPMRYDGWLYRDDYEHGYRCAEQGILPYGVECALGLNYSAHPGPWVCPICSEQVKRCSRKKCGASHDFGFPCDGSNPFEHRRKEYRRKQYEELKREFELSKS